MRIYEVKNRNDLKFDSSGAQMYFRTYEVPEEYFQADKVSYTGLTVPFDKLKGMPSEKERSKYYYLYMYAKK